MLSSEDRTFIRSLPLLFVASVLLIAGAFSFWKNGNSTLSITSASVGVFLLGTWSATAVSDWSKHHRKPGSVPGKDTDEEGSDE